MDIGLPGGGGELLLREIRQDPRLADLPVIAVTAQALPGDRERLLGAGFDGYFSKPIDTRTFGGEIEAFLRTKGTTPSSPETEEERVEIGSIEMTWSPMARLARLAFKTQTAATGTEAKILVAALERWIGTTRKPFALLGDGTNLSGLDGTYRAVWSAFFKKHREDSCIAFFNMGPVIRVAAEMFRLGTGMQLKAFSTEADARAWLRRMEIPA